jgi:hypothetical protein
MINLLQFGFSQFISFKEENLWNFSQSEHIIGPGSHVEYPTITYVSGLFSSPGPKVHGNYCHHLASVVCKLFTFQASSPKPLGQLEPNLAGMLEENLWNFSQSEHIIGPGSHVEYPTGTKNIKFVEDHPRNIPAKFGSNWPSGFGEEAWNVKSLQTTDAKWWQIDHWNVFYQVSVFYVNRKSKMAATAGHRLTLDPMGKCSNAFFSETTNMTALSRCICFQSDFDL